MKNTASAKFFCMTDTLLRRGSQCQELSVRASSMADRAPKVRASARKNMFYHTFVRFSVLLTITRDPCKLEGRNKTNDLILNLTPENVTQHSRIVTTTRKGSSTPTKMSKVIGRQIH